MAKYVPFLKFCRLVCSWYSPERWRFCLSLALTVLQTLLLLEGKGSWLEARKPVRMSVGNEGSGNKQNSGFVTVATERVTSATI